MGTGGTASEGWITCLSAVKYKQYARACSRTTSAGKDRIRRNAYRGETRALLREMVRLLRR